MPTTAVSDQFFRAYDRIPKKARKRVREFTRKFQEIRHPRASTTRSSAGRSTESCARCASASTTAPSCSRPSRVTSTSSCGSTITTRPTDGRRTAASRSTPPPGRCRCSRPTSRSPPLSRARPSIPSRPDASAPCRTINSSQPACPRCSSRRCGRWPPTPSSMRSRRTCRRKPQRCSRGSRRG